MDISKQNYLKRIAEYVVSLFDSKTTAELCYHNLEHTKAVVKNAAEMADFYRLKNMERFVLLAAAWFHDTGQLFGPMDGHEKRGAFIMEQFLRSQKIDASIILAINKAIMATEANTKPTNLIEDILRDSDVYHLGTKDFPQMDKLVWKETEQRSGHIIPDKLQKSLDFLNKHCFYTAYCKDRLLTGKKANIEYLEGLIKSF
ncbi:metal-dependent phosphohydrolase [Elizabethkingia anophelis]|nr:metal-dependent phosphohydrolase [Elizabethkingia anophelis]